jgi:folate-dependent phosphoribosylglycinamide formyltransferase PurN
MNISASMRDRKLVLIARAGDSTSILYNALSKFYDTHVFLEEPPSATALMRSRVRRLGAFRVIGQILFQVLVSLPLSRASRGRRRAIIQEFNVSVVPPPQEKVDTVLSVNYKASWDRIGSLTPDVIVINGTRILTKATLLALGVPVINTHVGITPRYRGVHGAYWALVNKDLKHCGITVHLVDPGIDTGGILHQELIHPTDKDNFTTYPTLQMAVGTKVLCQAVGEVIDGSARVVAGPAGSKRWYHPTLWEYIRNYVRLGVR